MEGQEATLRPGISNGDKAMQKKRNWLDNYDPETRAMLVSAINQPKKERTDFEKFIDYVIIPGTWILLIGSLVLSGVTGRF